MYSLNQNNMCSKIIYLAIFMIALLGGIGCKPVDTCEAPIQSGLLSNKICGMSLTATRNAFAEDPMAEMAVLGMNWVTLLPYNSFNLNDATINFDTGNWWGETVTGISTCQNLATAQGMKTMIKPQLWSRDAWIGDMDYTTTTEWDTFHVHYTNFICYWAGIADSLQVDLFCIGTEVKQSATKYPDYWRGLIDTVRQIYSGPITYAPNWDEYDQIVFWDKLDYIGVDAYFSLIPDVTPKVCDLKTAWEPIFNKLEAFSEEWNKPILFTEWGYLSLDGCAYQTWELEKDRNSVSINEQAQANAAQALLETFGKADWWAGGFQWKWYSDISTSTRDYSDDYTPQRKITEDVLKELYQ